MNGVGLVVIDAGRSGGLQVEVAARLAGLGLRTATLPRDASIAARHALLVTGGMLVSLYPEGAEALMCVGLAVGLGLRVAVLAEATEPGALPRGVEVFGTVQALVDATPPGAEGRLIDEPLIERLRLGPAYRDWQRRRYPQGLRSTDWTVAEQVAALGDGGGASLKAAFDAGVIEQHSMAAADLGGVDLTDLRLNGADFAGAKLAGARLRGADLVGADFAAADLSGADLSGAALLRGNVAGATMNDATLDDASFDRCTMSAIAGQRLSAIRARVTSCALTGADLAMARLGRASFRDVDFTGADLSRVEAAGAQFRNCRFTGASFADAVLDRAVLVDCVVADLRDGEAALAAAHLVRPRRLGGKQ